MRRRQFIITLGTLLCLPLVPAVVSPHVEERSRFFFEGTDLMYRMCPGLDVSLAEVAFGVLAFEAYPKVPLEVLADAKRWGERRGFKVVGA